MSRRSPRPASEAFRRVVDDLAPLSLLSQVQRVWPSVVGDAVAAEATPTGERGGTLQVTCRSAVWAQELDLMGPDVTARLNTALGREAVAGLRCSAAPPRAWAEDR